MPSVLSTDPAYSSLVALRQDAIDRGLNELALTYGWAAIERADKIMVERFGQQQFSFLGIATAARNLGRLV
jgi:hypothetical protein